jgi:cytoskeletal protein RodZ
MKLKTLFRVSLALGAILMQAACGSAATGSPADSTTTGANHKSTATDTVILPEGTPLAVRTNSALSTESQEAGQSFSAVLDQPVLLDGREIAAKGADVQGKIVEADKGAQVKGVASMTVELNALRMGGQLIYISTNSVTQSPGAAKGKDAVKTGTGAGVGAAVIPSESLLNFTLSAAVQVTVASR